MTGAPKPVASPSQTIGPFFHVGPGGTTALGHLAPPGTPGARIRLEVRVIDGEGAPVPDSLVEILQANAAGQYADPMRVDPRAPGFTGFGRLPTSDEGLCVFETITPGRVEDGRGGRQAAHINVCVFMRGLSRHVYTRIYFEGDPSLREDALLSVVPPDRRGTLVARPAPQDPATWRFDIRLQGESETVFFDV